MGLHTAMLGQAQDQTFLDGCIQLATWENTSGNTML